MRMPWPPDFPDVVVHATVRERDRHPHYVAGKSGDPDAAFELAFDLLNDAALDPLRELIGNRPVLLLPVVAEETLGFNAIPDAFAQILARELDQQAIAGEIVQINKVGHTRAPTFQRLVTPAEFAGPVVAGAQYLLIDDHVGIGGTLANLRGHVERNGGHVIGMTTLTESRDGRGISLRPDTRTMLWEKHGQPLGNFWSSHFGYGIDCLTEVEGQNLCRQQTVIAIENFLAKAAVEASGRGLVPAVG